MKITVVIPLYNVAGWIGDCLRSVVRQAADLSPDDALECIVVDDCGTDGSRACAEEMADGIRAAGIDFRIIGHSRNRGLSAARNTGTAAATGDYLFYLDGDDELEPGALAAMAAVARTAGSPDWVQGNYRRVEASGRVREVTAYFDPAQPVYTGRPAVVAGFGRLNFINAHNKLIRLDFIRDNGLDFCDGITYEDVLWCMEAYPHVTRVATTDAVTYRHNLRAGSIMRSAMTEGKLDSLLHVERRLAAMPRDANVGRIAGLLGAFGMKHLYLTRFPGSYRRRWMAALWASGVPQMVRSYGRTVRAELQPLSRMVSWACFLPLGVARAYLRTLLLLYGVYLRLRGRDGRAGA